MRVYVLQRLLLLLQVVRGRVQVGLRLRQLVLQLLHLFLESLHLLLGLEWRGGREKKEISFGALWTHVLEGLLLLLQALVGVHQLLLGLVEVVLQLLHLLLQLADLLLGLQDDVGGTRALIKSWFAS